MYSRVYLETVIIITYGILLSIIIWQFQSGFSGNIGKGLDSDGFSGKKETKAGYLFRGLAVYMEGRERGTAGVTMAVIWTGMVVVSVVCGLLTGNGSAVAAAALDGAASAVELCLSMAGVLCLWMGVMEVMKRAGLAQGLSRLLRPVLRLLYPEFARDRAVMDSIAANVSANLLGLGNAATPMGIQAARLMSKKSPGVASDSLCMLVVCNTASIQLIPTTVAGVRLAAGCAAPFDILPAVWLASALSVCAGILAVKLLSRLWGDGPGG